MMLLVFVFLETIYSIVFEKKNNSTLKTFDSVPVIFHNYLSVYYENENDQLAAMILKLVIPITICAELSNLHVTKPEGSS